MPHESLGAGRHGTVPRSDQNNFPDTERPTAAGDPGGAVGETGPIARCPKGLRSFVPPARIPCSNEGN
jgi:hypothetical protein